jgi:hypothetical protein
MCQEWQMQEIELKPSCLVHSSVLNKICTMQLLWISDLYGIIYRMLNFQSPRTNLISIKLLWGGQAGGSNLAM